MGESVVLRLNELTQFDADLHWFCPRSTADDSRLFFDEDVLTSLPDESEADKALRLQRINDSLKRRDAALEAVKIFAFDGSDAVAYQQELKHGLKGQLVRCDICVREYHRSRALLVQQLESLFEAEEVRLFMDKFDAMNTERINAGLKLMTDALLDLPPDQRTITAAGDEGMYALFEALHCIPFLQNEDTLKQHFDQPFRLVQTKRRLKLPSFAPGMAAFLFSRNDDRLSWATRNLSTMKRSLTSAEFEHSLKPFLDRAVTHVDITALEVEFLPTFWRAMKLIVSKLTKAVVTTQLRAMDTNIYTLALEHFQVEAAHFPDLLGTYQALLELSPADFWEAMGSISAQSVIENIFRSPELQKLLKETTEIQPLQLEEKMEWTVQIVRSLKPANIVPPVKIILDQLLHTIQEEQYSRYASSVCKQKGYKCLLTSLQLIREHVRSAPIITHMVQVVASDHMSTLIEELDGIEKKDELQINMLEQFCLDIIDQALALDIIGLTQDRYTLVKTKMLDHELGVSGQDLWKRSMRHIRPGRPSLAASVLHGVTDLLQLEKFPPRHISAAPKQGEAWNHALTRLHNYVVNDLLERLDLFKPDQLDELFVFPAAAQGLVNLLFNGEPNVHQAALSVLKSLGGSDDRRASIMHMVSAFPTVAFPSVNEALFRISKHRVFAPCSIALRICTDVFSCLCDSQDGILRTKKLSKDVLDGINDFWQRIWRLLGMIFEQTEPWSNLGYDKNMMSDFCRETMDFADYAFDQYSILASTMQDVTHANADEVRKKLLEQPKSKFGQVTKWLRLRDEYLINKAVSLTTKILGRLREVGITVEQDAAQYLESVVVSSDKHPKIKTRLSMQQKAELQRALERHLGQTFSDVIGVSTSTRATKQSSLEGWASSARSSGASTPVSDAGQRSARPGTIDVEAWSDAAKRKKERQAAEDEEFKKMRDSMPGQEAYRKRLLQQQQQQKKPSVSSATAKSAQMQKETQSAFLLKRQKEREEAEKRKAAMVAKANGAVGIGSGVSGLGDIGKDHSMKGRNVMVSSDEESDDDDDDEPMDADLFGPTPKKKFERPNVDPNGAVGLRPEQKNVPTKIHRIQRSLGDRRARLAPDLTSLHRTILKWEFFHTGDYPPGANEHQFKEVADSFTNPVTYQETFQPLLTLEAWQGMVKAREENVWKPYEVKIQNRTNVDQWIEISSLIGHVQNRDIQLIEGDIILLSKVREAATDSSAPHCLARVYRIKRQKAHQEIVYQVLPNSSLAPSLTQQGTVWGVKVQSIIPLEREYGALQALQYYDLCNQIVKAKPSHRLTFSEKQIGAYQDVWNVNRAQSEAINAALTNEGFTLIQGPPGSGKTKTIVAIVGGLLTDALSGGSVGTKISLPKSHGNTNAGGDAPLKKLLVCAPSNAAVDELVMRLKEGIKTKGGRHHQLNIVRIGRSEAINQQVMDVTMEELVSKRLGTNDNEQKLRERNAELFKEHEKVSNDLKELYAKRDGGGISAEKLTAMEADLANLRKKKKDLGVRIDNAKDAERNAGRQAELNRKRAQQAVLDEAHVICATLSGSGHDMFQSLNIDLETVIIDEAAQCVEMSSLIPMKYGCVKCIMVGDPKQLPPTVFSKEAAKFQYEQSLFVRMQNNFPAEVHLLDVQYRMHPDISLFPSRTFYDELLKDGPGMAALRVRPWHASSLLAPYRFFDVAGQHQAAPKGHSLVNLAEIEIAMALYDRLKSDFPRYDFTAKIGIITPYKSQLGALKSRFTTRFGNDIFDNVEFNTTDAFQGRESEIIIFSCVRASPAGGIGFLQDIRRMNVGLTRAKCSLWVLGNSESLGRGQYWKKLVEDARARDCYTTGNLKGLLSQPSSSHPAAKMPDSSMWDVDSHPAQMKNGRQPTSDASMAVHGNGAVNTAPQQSDAVAGIHADRMEGVRYRFEDRVKKDAVRSESDSNRSTPAPANGTASDDVEMRDTDGASEATNSRAATPLAADELKAKPANGPAKIRTGSFAPAVAQQLKKRPAASPFMPRKQAKPKQP